MTEHPILFSTDMVKAILDGRKTMTRRVKGLEKVNINPSKSVYRWDAGLIAPNKPGEYWFNLPDGNAEIIKCPYLVGNRLWVRETWDSDCTCGNPKCNGVIYKAGYSGVIIPDKWRSSIFMPRWASRINLEITNIKIERLKDITEEDARKEGDPNQGLIASENDHKAWFINLWDSIHDKGSPFKEHPYHWEKNPWVWVIEFKVIEVK